MKTHTDSGFTLIEVVISMMILAVLSVLTTNAMRRAIDNRSLVSAEVERDAKLSDALRVMRADITAAYHHRDIAITLQNAAMVPDPVATPKQGLNPDGGEEPTIPPAATPPPNAAGTPAPTPRPTPVETTGFEGDGNSLYFTSLSNIRTLRDSKESDQAKIGYFVKSCQVRANGKSIGSKCLYRSTTPTLDKDITTPGPETVLLENVNEFQLRYLGPGNEEYVEAWKSGESGDQNSKGNFPYAVEVTITTLDRTGKSEKKAAASALIPLWFPNNKPKTDAKATSDANTKKGQGP